MAYLAEVNENKSLILFGSVLAALTVGALGVLFVFMKPASVKEAEVIGLSSTHFPDAGGKGANAPAAAVAAAPTTTAPVQTGPSSLSFIQKGEGVEGAGGTGAGVGTTKDAEQAAARGDASGVMSELRKGNESDRRAAATRTRATMQAVVDAVHEAQPSWYREFLSHRELKRIADQYDRNKDFRAFVGALADSGAFMKMLAAKAGTSGMRTVVRSIFGDERLARDVRRVADENADEPKLAALVKKYGRKCGLPKDLLAGAGADAAEEPAPVAAPKTTRRAASAPKLQLKAFDNGRGSSAGQFRGGQLGGGQQQQQAPPGLPPGVDVEQLKKQYGAK